MKIILIYIAVLSGFLLCIHRVVRLAPNPEKLILGQWSRPDWRYGAVKTDSKRAVANYAVPQEEQKKMADFEMMHRAERWEFLPNGVLLLSSAGKNEQAKWCIKGRGNMLELTFSNKRTEQYSVADLSQRKLLLLLDVDTHVRGTIKLSFRKKLGKETSYAEKI